MPWLSTFRRLEPALLRFGEATEANIAVTFAIALVPILAFIGAAIDYSRANMARSSMQAALDSAALMVAKDLSSGVISTSDISTAAQNYFAALYTNKQAEGVSVSATYNPTNGSLGSTVLLNASADIKTDFMYLFGFPTMDFNTSSTTAWGNARLRVAMVLDNTGSMAQDGKMTALHSAAAGSGGLIDQLSALSKTDGDVYISVVPFAKTVNVTSTNYGANWIDWTDWLNPPTTQPNNGGFQATLPKNWHAIGPDMACPWTTSNGGFFCTTGPGNGRAKSTNSTSRNVVPPTGSTYAGYICPSADFNTGTYYNGCWTSVPANPATGVFCQGSSSCACPVDHNGNVPSSCSCTGSGSNKSCTGNLYVHNWTQPGSTAPVGFTSNKWTPTNSTPTVANNYTGTSTNPTSTWTGCVIDRTQPNDATTVEPSSDVTTQFPANQYVAPSNNPTNNIPYCDSNASTKLTPVIPLSQSWSTLKTAINAMQPTGGTNQAIGLSVGAQTLIPGGAMFNAPAEDPNYTYNRAIILLSDGLNTQDRWRDYGDGSTQNTGSGNSQFPGLIDNRQAQLCDALKANDPSTGRPKYVIYTGQVNTHTPADPTSTVLQYCASSPDKFFMLTSSSQIVAAFKSIGTSLSQLRVAR